MTIHYLNCFTCNARIPRHWKSGQLFLLIESNDRLVLGDKTLKGVSLIGTNLAGASFFGVNLENAFLMGAKFESANLRDAEFETAELKRANLEGATYDTLTKWPDGFDPELAGAKHAPPQESIFNFE